MQKLPKYVILINVKDVCGDVETRYVYNTNCKLSQLRVKIVNGTVTKYVYGRGLIGEETGGTFKTYHYDCRGSTVAITDMDGNVTDTFEYDTYGKLTARTGTSDAVFLYNGRDGVITEPNGLYYMRARYYSPDKHRFINADIIPGKLDKSPTLNRFAYADGNPVMNVDPLGLLGIGIGIAVLGVVLIGVTVLLTGSTEQEESSNDNQSDPPINQFFDNDSHKVEGSVSEGAFHASGSVSGGNSDMEVSSGVHMEKGPDEQDMGFVGVDSSISVINAQGQVGITSEKGNVSLNGNIDILEASLAAGLFHEDTKGLKLGGGASVVSAELYAEFEIFGFGFIAGVSGELLSADAFLQFGIIRSKGKTEIAGKPKLGAGLYGYGFDIGLILPG